MTPPLAQLLDAATRIAQRAGEVILEIYDSGPTPTQLKADQSPLTAADLAAHALIVRELGALQPQYPVLSEEDSNVPFLTRRSWSPYWLVDPLDGTREFVSRNGEFTVNIALVVEHRAILGVVHVPVTARTYGGALELGAFREERAARTRIAVAQKAGSPLRVAGSRSHGDPALARVIERMGAHELIAVGSSIKFCMLAEGSIDLYPRLGPTSEWDTAAGQAVLEAAGGAMLALPGFESMRYNRRESLLNPHFLAYADAAVLEAWRRAYAR